MADSPFAYSHSHLAPPPPRGRPPRPTPDMPVRPRDTDDLFSNLTPRSALEAFRNPSGSLKECMATATPYEQSFAIRAAIASQSIQEWLDELKAWPWPSTDRSIGFEIPANKSKRLSHTGDEPSPPDLLPDEGPLDLGKTHYGSLSATDVSRYERRLEEISRGMEDLDLEEIKSQVLHNHIMPLSRPSSPMMDSNMSVTSSLSGIARMDDLTALLTATLLQALPSLSRLARLITIWNIRVLVLRRTPVFLASLEDGEVAIESGWNAINASSRPSRDDASNRPPSMGLSTLSRKEFDVMKSILGRKVAKAGRDLDIMLDMLEGSDDTLPGHWLDRVDALEQNYSEWTVACEQKIREADWARYLQEAGAASPAALPGTNPANTRALAQLGTKPSTETSPTPEQGSLSPATVSSVEGDSSRDASEPSETVTSLDTSLRLRDESPPPLIKVHLPEDESIEGQDDGGKDSPAIHQTENGADHGRLLGSIESTQLDGGVSNGKLPDLDDDDDDLEDWPMEGPEPELPYLPRPRRDSEASNMSTVVHEMPSDMMNFSSDQLEQGTPELPRLRDDDLDPIPSDDFSLEVSPRPFRSSVRSVSVSFNDMPTVAEIPDDESALMTPLQSSFLEEAGPSHLGSPAKITTAKSDDQLQQQISEILESVPVKIRLTTAPSAINLNPPDFTMPTRRTPKDAYPRSQSSLSTVSNMSSRAGTPSFTLAPAYNRNSRMRNRGNQEIKLYHLSRSNGEAPIKLFIRCVGEQGERVMVRVGGGWADLGEYLKEYASHHGRRSARSKVEIKDLPILPRAASTPPVRPASAQDAYSPTTPLRVRKIRRSAAAEEMAAALGSGGHGLPKTPLALMTKPDTPDSGDSAPSRSSSRLSWAEEDSSLGMAGPKTKHAELSEESKLWVESVKEKVRLVSGERKLLLTPPPPPPPEGRKLAT
ncbi:hypothetical protein B0T18DRAFT_318864 [Schizothecium vesticola]|uniref:GAR domain-containing protein n=1 Tax=Schizothecium vesticola TaxID=314040 RepID=A0AA40F6Z3_9PEZI|nr:hypothetical protein B0T18DRAFT_318864 [Schizothecium vesticola]